MTVRKVWLGSTGPFLYDDSVLYIDEDGVISPDNQQAIATDGQIVIQSPPSSPVHAVRKQDLDDALGNITSLEARVDSLEDTTAALGTMSTQNSNAVDITGGSASLSSAGIGAPWQSGFNLIAGMGKSVFQVGALVGIQTDPIYPFDAAGDMRLLGHIGVGDVPRSNERLTLTWPKDTIYGLTFNPLVSDAGPGVCVLFRNVGGGVVGSINTTGSTTSYNTSSDARLKHAIITLTNALDVVLALRPVQFLWKADNSPGYGFLAHEVQNVVDGVVTGASDAVDDAGSIMPQQIDTSKLVPWLTAAIQELMKQVTDLTARVAELEAI